MSFTGRIDRRVYIYSQIFLAPFLYLAAGLCVGALASMYPDIPTTHLPSVFKDMKMSAPNATTLAWVSGIPAAVLLVVMLSFTVRRLHDLDFSGWFLLLWPAVVIIPGGLAGDIPDTSTIFEAILMMVPGIAGPNDHGNDPRPLAVAARETAAHPS